MAITALTAQFSDTTGGVKKLSLLPKASMPSVTPTSGDLGTVATTAAFVAIQFEEFTCEATADYQEKDGRGAWKLTIKGYANGISSTILTWLRTAARTSGVVAFIETYDGAKLVFGWDQVVGIDAFLKFKDAKGGTGKGESDKLGFEVTFEGMQKEAPYTYTSLT